MAPRSRLNIAKKDIVAAFQETGRRVFTKTEIDAVLRTNRQFWRLAQATTTNEFIEFLLKSTELQLHQLRFPRSTNRYTWGNCPTLEIIQSLQSEGYFSHFTAMHLHGLTEQIPKTIYFNCEQEAASGGGDLTQAAINRAFATKCRVSNNITEFRGQTVCQLNGGNTGRLGVEELTTSDGAVIKVTNIERTLVDSAVRPIYSGGVFEVAKAYSNGFSRYSVNRMVSYLKTLNYTYPYHQAIGFYMERSGKYSETQLSLLRQFKIEFDFFLTHNLKQTKYVANWKLFVPEGM